MVSREEYESIRSRIMQIIDGANPSIDPADLLRELRRDGISRELGSTVMLEMVGAGYISRRPSDWQLSRGQETQAPAEVVASAY